MRGDSRIAVLLSLTFVLAEPASAQKFRESDPLPPGARGKVLALQGKVLDIKGLSSGVAGKAEALTSALKDLSAKTSGTEVRIELSSDVLFDFDKDALRAEAAPTLQKVVTVIQSYPGASTTVEGHSDSVGADAYNQRLSERRASSVQQWLQAHGVTGSMSAKGWGESKPVVPNTNPDGSDNPQNRQKNRRVEIVVTK